MNEPYLGQITLYAFGYAPKNWAICDGARMPVLQNQALHSLLLSHFGGDETYFNLPDLRGRTPVAMGNDATLLGQFGGDDTFTVPDSALGEHRHSFFAMVDAASTQLSPQDGLFTQMPSNGTPPIVGLYNAEPTSVLPMSSLTVSMTGASLPAENRQPSLALNFCIATFGDYPPRN